MLEPIESDGKIRNHKVALSMPAETNPPNKKPSRENHFVLQSMVSGSGAFQRPRSQPQERRQNHLCRDFSLNSLVKE